jgi:uncharacterized membrane protein YtjA (UPF0391 family)
MLRAAAGFLILAIVAAAFGMGFIAGISTQIAWILFVVFLVLALLSLVTGRRTVP